MNIAIFNVRGADEQQFISQKLTGHTVDFFTTPISKDSLPDRKDYEAIAVFTDSKVDAMVINALPNLKFIAAKSTGFDHIDLKTCAQKGIVVSNTPVYGESTVAEYTLALILALAKKIPQAVKNVKTTEEFSREGLTGIDLKDKTLGVIGTGHIGSHVIQMAKGFEMKVLAFDAYPNAELSQKLGFEYLPLDEILQKADIITFHVPSLPTTKHMLNSQNFSKIKKGAMIINTSRGEVLETQSLVTALQQGIISQAAMDVLENEDALRKIEDQTEQEKQISALNDKLIEMENVLITPHNASNTKEATVRIWQTTVDNILSFQKGTPENIVKPQG